MKHEFSTNYLKENNAKHYWHPMVDPKISERDLPLIIARGQNCHVWDVDDNKYLDLMGGLWCVNVGHNRSEINVAIADQLGRISYYNTFNGFSNPTSIELSAKLTEMLEQENMVKIMFGSGGSDANETAIKLSRQYWKVMGQPEKIKIFSLKNGYHGMQFGAVSASGGIVWRRAYEPLMPGFYQVDTPDRYRNSWSEDPKELSQICAGILEREIQHQGPDTVAAFIAEPIQGAGGLIIPPDDYWGHIRKVCDKYDILLIADEVVTGFGRTGEMFGVRCWGVKPDIMNFAKGINSGYVPLGATAVNQRVAMAWEKDHSLAPIMHGYTYSGHPVACAAAIANLKIVEDENLASNAAKVGNYFLEKLIEIKAKHASIGDVRGRGLMLGIEFVKDRKTKEPFAPNDPYLQSIGPHCRKSGVLVRTQGHRIIISPPLTFTKENVDEAIDVLDSAFAGAK